MRVERQQQKQQHGLTPKQLAFADAYIQLGNVKGRKTQAAVKAGFPPRGASTQASRMLRNVEVATYIRARLDTIQKVVEEKQVVTRVWVIEQLKKVYAQSMIGEPEMVWEDGELVHSGLYTFSDRGANRSLELLGREIGMFEAKKKPDDGLGGFSLTINLGDDLPDRKPMKDVTPEADMQAPTPETFKPPVINLE